MIEVESFIKSESNAISIAKLMLETDEDLNSSDKFGNNILMHLVELPNTRTLIEKLCEHNINLDKTNNEGETVLSISTKKQNMELVRYFIKRGANLNLLNKEGNSITSNAIKNNYPTSLIKLLLDSGADVNLSQTNGLPPLIHSIKLILTNMDYFNLILKYKPDVNLKNNKNWSPLRYLAKDASCSKMYSCMKILLDNGANPWDIGPNSSTLATLIAKNTNHTSSLEALILIKNYLGKFSDYLNLADGNEWTPLMFASKFSNKSSSIATVRFLLENGADPTRINKSGQTALMLACSSTRTTSSEETIQLLTQRCYSKNVIDYVDIEGYTALSRISCKTLTESTDATAELLIRAGANLNIKNIDGMTALMLAVKCTNTTCTNAIVNILLSNGARVDITDTNGSIALMLALENSGKTTLPSTVEILLQVGSPLNIIRSDGNSAIFLAKNLDELDRLVRYGADLNHQDSSGNTLITKLAEKCTNTNVEWLHHINLLIDHGADLSITNVQNRTTYDILLDKVGSVINPIKILKQCPQIFQRSILFPNNKIKHNTSIKNEVDLRSAEEYTYDNTLFKLLYYMYKENHAHLVYSLVMGEIKRTYLQRRYSFGSKWIKLKWPELFIKYDSTSQLLNAFDAQDKFLFDIHTSEALEERIKNMQTLEE